MSDTTLREGMQVRLRNVPSSINLYEPDNRPDGYIAAPVTGDTVCINLYTVANVRFGTRKWWALAVETLEVPIIDVVPWEEANQ